MIKHLFQRTITRNGKKVKAWYYWFYDKDGKQVRKSCGTDGKPCLLKREAEAFLDSLDDEELTRKKITFEEYCKGFYDDDSRFIRKQAARGYLYQKKTLTMKQLFLRMFVSKFGNKNVNDINIAEIENWLIDIPYSSSTKNGILTVFEEIEQELYHENLIDNPIRIKHFKGKHAEKGVFTLQEIARLFPINYEGLIKVWRVRTDEKESDIYTFATMIYTILSTGMRSSEIRALQWNQFIRQDAILINAMIDSSNERVNRLKKWSAENKRWRITVLPDRTVKMINLLRLDKSDNDYVFIYEGKQITTGFLLLHFKAVLKRNGIDHQKRNLTIHSLRFTYNTLMRREISDEDLRLMVGHTSVQMTDYYDKSRAIDHLDNLLQNKKTINSIFN